jgi:hypothetical protein
MNILLLSLEKHLLGISETASSWILFPDLQTFLICSLPFAESYWRFRLLVLMRMFESNAGGDAGNHGWIERWWLFS